MTNVLPSGSASRRSTFSDKNLTTLESLVLECQLEDAHQQIQGSRVSQFEMSASDFEAITQLSGNQCCADCESCDTEWASVTFGILLCADCSGVHRALGTHISRVRSIKMDSWSKDHLEVMRQGGNRKCRRYLECHKVPRDQEIADKYASEPAIAYKQLLQDRVLRKQGKILDETESSTEVGSVDLSKPTTSTNTTMDESCTSFDAEQGAENNNLNNDSGGGWSDGEGTPRNSSNSSMQSSTLDSWFGANKRQKKKTPTLRNSNASVTSAKTNGSITSAKTLPAILRTNSTGSSKRSYRRSHSSNSTPTITYMGRSFSADGSDDCKLFNQQRIKSQSDIKLLADLVDQQEAIARENMTDASWRKSVPANYWSADKKIQPFLRSCSTGGYPFSSSQEQQQQQQRRGGRRASHRQETMRQKLAYTDEDLLKIAKDDQEFARLKAGLKHKGAVTNEMLRQKLYAFVAKSKLRRSGTTESEKNELRPPKLLASKSDDLSSVLLGAKMIQTSSAERV